jgi:hypothetical protein
MKKLFLILLITIVPLHVNAQQKKDNDEIIINEINKLLNEKKYSQAYILGEKNEALIKHTAFNKAFGIASIKIGKNIQGILALQRYLIAVQNDFETTYELALALYKIQENNEAEIELKKILEKSNSTQLKEKATKLISEIRSSQINDKNLTKFYTEFGLGFDDNVNGGVNNQNVNLPQFGLTLLDPSGVKSNDTYARFSTGMFYQQQISAGMNLISNISYDTKIQHKLSDYNTESINGKIGILKNINSNSDLLISTSTNLISVNQDKYRDTVGFSAEYSKYLDQKNTLSTFYQFANHVYANLNALRDSQTNLVGIKYRKEINANFEPVMNYLIHYADDRNQMGRAEFGKNMLGAGVGIGLKLTEKWNLQAQNSIQFSSYQANDPTFLITREDTNYVSTLSSIYKFQKNWSIRNDLNYISNKSNIGIYEFDRTVFTVTLRYDF